MPDKKMTLADAIMSLDASIDAHWTKTGLPSLNALIEMTGARVTRKDQEDAGPLGFDREFAGTNGDGSIPSPDLDYVAELDRIFGTMTNNHRIYAEALFRLANYYRSERGSIITQLKAAKLRGNL